MTTPTVRVVPGTRPSLLPRSGAASAPGGGHGLSLPLYTEPHRQPPVAAERGRA